MMNVAVVGSSGYIAGYIIKRFEKIAGIEKILKLDKTSEADVILDLAMAEQFNYSLLDEIDYVVMTAAISSPDKCATDYDFCWQINVTGTSYFIRNAIEHGCRVLFFSSDAVFGDISGKIYDESSETKAYTPYGRMKKTIEDEFKDNHLFKAIRLSYVVSARDKFVSYCLGCIRRNEEADIFHPFYRNCITVSDVVDVVAWLSEHWEEYKPFVLNVAGEELVSRVRIADELNRVFKGALKYGITKPGDEFFRNRPAVTQMKSLYLKQYDILPSESFTEKIQKEMEEINNG